MDMRDSWGWESCWGNGRNDVFESKGGEVSFGVRIVIVVRIDSFYGYQTDPMTELRRLKKGWMMLKPKLDMR